MYKGYCITEETINDVTLPYFNENRMRKQAYEDALAELDTLWDIDGLIIYMII